MERVPANTTADLLPYPALADALLRVLQDKKAGRAQAPQRQSVNLPGGAVLLLMPAVDDRLVITKLVTVHPANAGADLPVVQADVLVCDAVDGRRLILLDGAVVTARRTAALSMLAARLLAPEPGGPLLVVGAGVQGRAHLEAFVEGLGVKQVYIASRTSDRAAALARYASESLGVEARAVDSANDAMDLVKLIVTATTSPVPVLEDRVKDDTFIAAVGAFTPDTAELPPALVRRAHLYVDTLEGCQSGAGDLIQAGIDWNNVTPLEDVPSRVSAGSGPIIFKSVGHALWDLAAARLAVEVMGL
jgi:1-piperideine-2-carboxylate/1-pyrroline-2-carboxylate reductase [NAD(P)H]